MESEKNGVPKGKFRRPQRKYRKLTLKDKNHVIELVESGESKTNVAKQFGLNLSSVTYIMKNKDRYTSAMQQGKTMAKRTRVDEGQQPHMEKCLLEWIGLNRSLGIAVTGPLIKEKALEFNAELIRVSKEEGNKQPQNSRATLFKASEGWLTRFKERNGIWQSRSKRKKLSAGEDGVAELEVEFVDVKTLALDEEQEAAGLNNNNERITVMNCDDATGNENPGNVEVPEQGNDGNSGSCTDTAESDNDVLRESTEEELDLREARTHFLRLRKWYERRTKCTKSDVASLDKIQETLETEILNGMYKILS